jgi:hypothetical protein
MADQIKLKAFVRIDGSGKVIPGGPIFQAQKPKVGKWREISIKECCNYNPNTTTTTTSSTSSTSTSTTTTTTTVASYSFQGYGASDPLDACARVNPELIVYANTPSLNMGVNLYMDAGLTVPYNRPLYGQYLSLYFAAQDQVCTMGGPFGNTISSYTAC